MSKLKHIFHGKDEKGNDVLFDHPVGVDGKVLRSSVSKFKPTSVPAKKLANPYR